MINGFTRPRVDSQQLAQFVAIAESGSYRRAAERLCVAQPALTISIKKLEHALRAQVFLRSSQGVTLTPAGRALLQHSRHALSTIEAGVRAAQAANAGMMGEFRLGFIGSAAYVFLPGILPTFRLQFPLVRITLMEGATQPLLDDLDDGLLDACVVRDPIASASLHNVHALESDTLIAVLPAGHALAGRDTLKLLELQGEPFIGVAGYADPYVNCGVSHFCSANGFTPNVVQTAPRAQTVVSLVGSGLGVALMPGVMTRFQSESVRFVPVETAGVDLQLHLSLVWRKETLNPTVGHFIELARASTSNGPVHDSPRKEAVLEV